jgi:multidrug efflux system outer membrane protein
VPAEWPKGPAYEGTAGGTGNKKPAKIGWREFYADERLQKVIDLALRNNRDLRIASANIDRARAMYRIQQAELVPSVDAAGSVIRQRVPADISDTGNSYTYGQYGADLGVTAWELDFFGRIRGLRESALEQYFATEQAWRNVQTILVADVAAAYLVYAADCESLELVWSTLKARQESYDLIRRRFDVGASSNLDVRQARTLLESARVDFAAYTRQVALDRNILDLLAGGPVPPELLAVNLAGVVPPRDIQPGLSSEVLLERPDVRQAENLLKAANADIGAARAAFFPRIALTGSIGTISTDLSGLFQAGSNTWLFSPRFSIPIFDPRTKAAYDVAKVDREIYLAQYEKAIQGAFKETADALAQRVTLKDQIAAQESLVAAASNAYRLSNARYKQGIDNYLAVLDAQRSLYGAQQGLITLRLAEFSNLVTLYKALGGGAV